MDYWYILDFKSYWSVWFWAVVVISWSLSAHFTFGVPHDLVTDADRDAALGPDVDTLARIYAQRIVSMVDRGGVWLVAIGAFVMTVIATFGWYVDFEFCRALFVLMLPHLFIGWLSVRRAYAFVEAPLTGEALRAQLRRWRFWTQVIGLCAIAFTAGFAVYETLRSMTLMNQ